MNVLRRNSPSRYKLQQLGSNSRWKDVSKYFPIDGSVLEALINLDLIRAKNLSPADLDSLEEADPSRFRYAFRRVFSQVVATPQLSQVDAWRDYFDNFVQVSSNKYVKFLQSTLRLLSTVLQLGIDNKSQSQAIHSALTAINADQAQHSSTSEQIAYFLIEGKLLSYVDRNAAAQAFARAIHLDSSGLIEHFYIDMGAYTYFGSDDQSSSPLTKEIQQSIESIQWTTPVNSLATVVSVDPHFFRIYAPQLYLFAQQLPELDVVILLCGEPEEVAEVLKDGEKYLEYLARLNRSGIPKNIQYLRVPVPPTVVQPKTFFACARFFAAEQVLQQYERVYVMDVDLTVEDNPRPYFERIKKVTFGTATNQDSSTLSPWRRNLAGNVALQGEVALKQVLPDLLKYIAHGLVRDHSWMLDQNALTFTAEQHPEMYTPLESFKRPFNQLKFRATLEKRYFDGLR